MSGNSPSASPTPLRNPGRPEALEFARSGRVDNRISAEEFRERTLLQFVLFVLFCTGVLAGCVFYLF